MVNRKISIFILMIILFSGCASTQSPSIPSDSNNTIMPCHESTNLYIRWAAKKVTVQEAEKENMIQDDRLGPKPLPFGFINDEWEDIKNKMHPGDELWYFSSPPDTWDTLTGQAGYVLIRNCKVVAVIVSEMN